MMFGVMEQAPFEEDTVLLSSGDRVIVYTDGITERTNPAGEEYGPDRLAVAGGVAAARAHRPPGRPSASCAALDAFSQGVEPNDDQTLMVLRMRD